MKTETLSQYEQQAQDFLQKHGITFRATLSDSKAPQWGDDGKHGHHYRVTLSRHGEKRKRGWYEWQNKAAGHRGVLFGRRTRLTFDFWSSIADMEKGVKTVGAYDVLACISGDVNCPDTFKDFCGEYGYEADSIKALQTFRRVSAFSKRLRAFFTEAEIADLQEIQ